MTILGWGFCKLCGRLAPIFCGVAGQHINNAGKQCTGAGTPIKPVKLPTVTR